MPKSCHEQSVAVGLWTFLGGVAVGGASQVRAGAGHPSVERLTQVATLAAVGLLLSYVESMIPLPTAVPGVKLGLSNVAVLVCLCTVDARAAALVAVVKVLAAGFLFGSPMMIAYSAAGTLLAFLSMLLMERVLDAGEVATSMVAAIMHNAGQLLVATLALSTPAVLLALPVLAASACATGALTGLVARGVVSSLRGRPARPRVAFDLDLEVAPGELVAFVGRNGSGKTSFALQWAAEKNAQAAGVGGECAGRVAAGAGDRAGGARTGQVGLCFQDPDDQAVCDVVQDDVAFALENRGTDPCEMRTRVAGELAALGIAELAGRPLDELSGGQRSKANVAGLLAGDFDVIVFDEVTAMLDAASTERFFSLVDGLRERGVGVVLVTHRMEEALRADRVCVFSDARLLACEPPDRLAADDALLARAGLELPAVMGLARELRARGISVPLTADPLELAEALCR
ncbi:MAG: Gx transporter family protein [Olsenella sp.]|jgi:energy-coupling factor transport system ATP-binding protein